MARNVYLLDTSALVTLIEDEDGADRVQEILTQEQALIPWSALMEVYYITLQERGQGEADQRYALLKLLPATILWTADEATLLKAGNFKARYRLSFADAVVAAFAAQHKAILVHKDPEFEPLAQQVTLEALPYKNG